MASDSSRASMESRPSPSPNSGASGSIDPGSTSPRLRLSTSRRASSFSAGLCADIGTAAWQSRTRQRSAKPLVHARPARDRHRRAAYHGRMIQAAPRGPGAGAAMPGSPHRLAIEYAHADPGSLLAGDDVLAVLGFGAGAA